MFRHCAPCHRPGEAAPFSLLTYRDVRQRAGAIVAATERRYMPPWLPGPGDFAFAGERRLTPGEIDTLRRWEEQGAPEGDPDDLPPAPRFADGWRLGQPDLVIDLPQPYTLPDASERWRNFVVPVPSASTRYVKTVEIRPGSARLVHHALMGVDGTRASRRRDEKDREPGFEGMDMGDAQAPDGHLLGWTPGMAPFPGIEGKAWRLEPGTDLVLQLHLTPSGKPETVNPRIGLYFTNAAPAGPPIHLLRLDADHAIDIPAGATDFAVADTFVLPVDVELLAVYPHAHFLARTVDASARLPDGTAKRLLRIDDWNFKWQDVYRYATPVPLPRGTAITMRWVYDNSAANPRNPSRPPGRVVAGIRSSDEMAHLQLQIMTSSERDLSALKEAFYGHAVMNDPANAWLHYELGNLMRERNEPAEAIRYYRAALRVDAQHAPALNNLGTVLEGRGESKEAMRLYREALRVEPDFADAHFNLGNVLLNSGRLEDAVAEYHAALRLEPALAEAHNNLGAALGQQGKLAEAIVHFKRALEVDPGHDRARENLKVALERK